MKDSFEVLARDEADVPSARAAIWSMLGDPSGHRTVYAALCRWTWRALVERRLDSELRSWHRLLLDSASRILAESGHEPTTTGRAQIDRSAAAERLRALADLIRLSVEAAEASDVKELVSRAHVGSLLRLLARSPEAFVERERLREDLGLRDANLSRVLTLLAANGLVDREARGKIAAFRITRRGLELVADRAQRGKLPAAELPHPVLRQWVAPAHDANYEPLLIQMALHGGESAAHTFNSIHGNAVHLNSYMIRGFSRRAGNSGTRDVSVDEESKRASVR